MDPVTAYHALKTGIETMTGQSQTLLHVNGGLAIYLLFQLALGTRRGSWIALALLAQIELLNEILDRFHHGSWRFADTMGDMAATMTWPLLLVLASTYRRRRWAALQAKQAQQGANAPSSPVDRAAVLGLARTAAAIKRPR
jgi:hypothetical protein